MKNIMVFDDGQDYFYDIHSVSDDDFAKIFSAPGQNVEFHDDLYIRPDIDNLDGTFKRMWFNRRRNTQIHGLHGMLFYENWDRKPFYPGKRDFAHARTTRSGPVDPDTKIVLIVSREPSEPIVACAVALELFASLFARPRQDVLFYEDIEEKFGRDRAIALLSEIKQRVIDKNDVKDLSGTIYIGYPEKRVYFVDRIDEDIPRHYPLVD